MKRIISTILAAAISSSMIVSVHAQEEMFAVYDFSTDSLTVSGTFNSKKETVQFMVLPSEENINSATAQSINENKYLTYQIRNESDGSFSFDIQMPSETIGGNYKVYAFCDDSQLSSEFAYVSKSELSSLLGRINGASSTELATMFSTERRALGINNEQLANASEIAALVCAKRPASGFTEIGFIEELNRSTALVLIKNNGNVDAIMINYGKSFGADAAQEIADMNSTVKASFVDYVKNNDVVDSTKEFFYQSILMGYVVNANSYAEMGDKINEYKTASGLNVPSNANTTAVYKKVYALNPATFSALESALINEAKNSGSNNNYQTNNDSESISGSAAYWSQNEQVPVSATSRPATAPEPFSDIVGHWGEDNIRSLISMGVISGYDDGSFKPDNYVTRAEFVKLIITALNIEINTGYNFSDVKESDWCYDYVSTAAQNGIVNGYGDEFKPNDNITRQDAAVILYRALGMEGGETAQLDYPDANDIADYAKAAVAKLTELGILSGSDDGFMPKNNTTRAEAATMILNMLEYTESPHQEEVTTDNNLAYGLVSALSTSETRTPYSKEAVSRGNFVQTVIEVLDKMNTAGNSVSFKDVDGGSEVYNAVSAAVTMSLIKDGESFRPDDAITVPEAVEICVNATGYGIQAVKNGNYISVGAQLGITDGISSTGKLSVADSYQMILNMLESDYYEWENNSYKKGDGDVLWAYRSMRKIRGIVSANEYTATGGYAQMNTSLKTLSGTVGIGDNTYNVSGDFNDYLGYLVEAYIGKDEYDSETVVYMSRRRENQTVEFINHEFEYADSTVESLNSRRKKYKLNKSIEVIYNGRVNYDYDLAELNNICGSIRLIDNNDDNKYDYIIIDDYYYMTVASFDRADKIIRDGRDESKEIILEDDVFYTVYNDGEQRECDLSEITQGTVLGIKRSADKQVIDILIIGRLLSGTIESYTADKIKMNGKEYYMTEYFKQNEYTGLKGSSLMDLYLGVNDEIVAVSYSETNMRYGYLVKAYTDDGDENLILKIFTDKGEMQKLYCEDSMICDGSKATRQEALNKINSTGVTQLIRYSVLDNGKIKHLDFSSKYDGYIDESKAQKVTDNLTRHVFGAQYYYRVSLFYPYFNIQNTLIFRVPENNMDDEESYSIGFSFNDGLIDDGKIEAYNVGLDGTADALVVHADNDETSINRTNPKIILVEDVEESVNENGEIKTKISGWENGQFKEHYLRDGIKIQKYKRDAEIAPGDIVRYTENDEEITAAVVDFVGSDRSPNTGDNLGYFNIRSTDCCYQVGSVYSYEGAWAVISKTAGENGYDYSLPNLINVKIPDNIAVYNTQTNKIRTGTKDDIKTYLNSGNNASYIVVKQYYQTSNFCIIYE